MLVVIRKYLPQLRLCGYQIRSYRWQDSVVASRSVQSLYLLGCLYELPSQSITYLSHIPYAQLFVSQVVSITAHYAQPSSWAKMKLYGAWLNYYVLTNSYKQRRIWIRSCLA